MEALVPAFVAGLLAGIGDRPALIAARGSDRAGGTIAGAVLTHLIVATIACVGGTLIAATMGERARALLLALVLLVAGIGALLPIREDARRDTPTILALLLAASADRSAFLAFGFAAAATIPALGAAGIAAAAIALALAAVAMGEQGWRALPRRVLGTVGGLLLAIAGLITALAAFGLI